MHLILMRVEYTPPTSKVVGLALENNVLISEGSGTETGSITPGTWDGEDY